MVQDMVLTCGFLHQPALAFKSLEWSRKRDRVFCASYLVCWYFGSGPQASAAQGLFFHFGVGSLASVFTAPGDAWLNRSQASYLVEERRDQHGAAITVLTLRSSSPLDWD
jgi:hypothetical protein